MNRKDGFFIVSLMALVWTVYTLFGASAPITIVHLTRDSRTTLL